MIDAENHLSLKIDMTLKLSKDVQSDPQRVREIFHPLDLWRVECDGDGRHARRRPQRQKGESSEWGFGESGTDSLVLSA
jgi:hypothetical protein